VSVGITRLDVVQVVGRHQRQVQRAGDAQQVLAEPALDRQPVVHEFAEVVAGAEDVAVVGRGGKRGVVPARLQPSIDLTARTAGGADQPRAVPLEQLPVEPRLVVVALEAGEGREPEEVVHPRGGLGPQGHVRVALLAAPGAGVLRGSLVETAAEVERTTFEPALRRVVALKADDRLDPVRLRALVELVGSVQIAVVGHRDGRHSLPGRLVEQVIQARGSVEHGVLGVHVQVHELVAA
jgi:uncharacterized protein